MLARFAEEQNTEQRFQALVQAGLAQPDTPANEWAAVVREYRDQVANAVFLPDVLLRGDLVKLLERLSAHGRNAITRAAVMLRQVHDAVGRPLGDVIRAGIEALDLDIDTVLAGVLHNPQHRANPALAHMPMDAIVDLVDTYTQEIAAEQTPSLHGFITWVDHLASVEDEAASLPDAPVDVELMTVHQSKGLEWDAVAVVGLTAVGFPSNQGDHLKIVLDEHHTGGTEQGHWTAPEYHETADSWLTNPTAVPVPMRADAGILPRFPHDTDVEADPIASLAALDDVELIDDEVFGSMREFGDGVEEVDASGWYLTQAEEYGRRLHADERRLMYVALTRAREDALMTYCARCSSGPASWCCSSDEESAAITSMPRDSCSCTASLRVAGHGNSTAASVCVIGVCHASPTTASPYAAACSPIKNPSGGAIASPCAEISMGFPALAACSRSTQS